MRTYRTDAPLQVSVECADSECTATLYDASGAQVAAVECDVADGYATAEVDPVRLGDYELVFSTGETVALEHCAAPYFTVEEFRAYDSGSKLSEDVTDEDIAQVREHVEDVFETAAGVPFRRRGAYERIVMRKAGTRVLTEHIYPQFVHRAKVDGQELAEPCTPDGMGVWLPVQAPAGSVVELWFEYGLRRTPGALKHNALVYADSLVGAPAVNPRATGMQAEYGYQNFSVAGKDGATGIPEVDAFLSHDRAKGGHGAGRLTVV